MSETIAGTTLTVPVVLTAGAGYGWAPSKRLVVMRAICDHIEGVTRAAGYEFTLTDRVFRGRAVFGDDTPVPCIAILEGPTPDANPAVGGTNHSVRADDWLLYVQGWVAAPEDHPTDPAYQLLASVEKRLSEIVSVRASGAPAYPDTYMLGGLIAGIEFGPGVVRPAQDQVSSRPCFYLPVVVRLPVDVSRPY